ncbi:hypothetical protein E2320_015286, partial [Naja naja]
RWINVWSRLPTNDSAAFPNPAQHRLRFKTRQRGRPEPKNRRGGRGGGLSGSKDEKKKPAWLHPSRLALPEGDPGRESCCVDERGWNQDPGAFEGEGYGRDWSVHNELEKHRRAQLRHCLEQLKQQIPTNTEHSRYTMLSLLHRARLHIKKLEHQEQKAQQVKERLRCEQQNLHQRLEELQAHLYMEQAEADSLDSSRFSSEHSDSEDEVDVEGLASASIGDVMAAFSTQQEHSYSNVSNFWLWTEAQLGGQHSSRQASNFSEITSR